MTRTLSLFFVLGAVACDDLGQAQPPGEGLAADLAFDAADLVAVDVVGVPQQGVLPHADDCAATADGACFPTVAGACDAIDCDGVCAIAATLPPAAVCLADGVLAPEIEVGGVAPGALDEIAPEGPQVAGNWVAEACGERVFRRTIELREDGGYVLFDDEVQRDAGKFTRLGGYITLVGDAPQQVHMGPRALVILAAGQLAELTPAGDFCPFELR
jgi:hypothetical protein